MTPFGRLEVEYKGAQDCSPHLRPAINRFFSLLSLKVVFDEIADKRSFSSDEEAPRIFWVASFQAIGSFKKLCSSSLRKPISTSTLTNSGNPTYLRVCNIVVLELVLNVRVFRLCTGQGAFKELLTPRMMVSASGML
jgi:hypothetical protein